MNKENRKKLIIVLALLAVVCLFAILVFSGIIDLSRVGQDEETTGEYDGFITDSYTQDVISTANNSQPYLKTNIEDIFYTMSAEGDVKFYQFADNAFKEVESTGVYTASVKLSEQTLSADITYYQQDDEICGYGVYSVPAEEYSLYHYALFCLRNYGSDYSGSSSSTCLLLIDTTQEDCYSNNKIYEESFTFNYSNSSASRSISEASRTVGITGAKRDDYMLINDATVENSVANQLFFSGRHYAESDTAVDIFRTGGSGNNTDNIRVAQDVLGYWLRNDGDDLTYITVDDNNNVVVEKFNWKSGKSEIVKTFDGVTRDDILVSGDYMYVISQNIIFNLVNMTEKTLNYSKAKDFTADVLAADGENIFIRGYVKERYPVGIIANAETGSVSDSYANELFRNVVNPTVLSDGKLILTVESENSFSHYIF